MTEGTGGGAAAVDGRVVVVTGGAQGIGLAICRRLAAEGSRVVVLDRNEEGAIAAAESLPRRGFGYGCDVADQAGVDTVAARVRSEVGPVEALVSNAGIGSHATFAETTPELQRRLVDVNMHGAFNVTRAFMDDIVDSGSGRIVFISSDAARVGVAGEAVYAAAKAGLIAFAKSLAVELARYRVTVNAVCPGSTNTEMFRGTYDEEQIAKRMRIHPMRRPAEADEVATAVQYFASRDASFTTAQVISVSGGMSRVG
ncbi:MAG: SDR family NAD(P)-dependent oxidoreductase [Streptosporangiales bacterium]|nr:SDR family NAD(P)-dependent oxidoreductase [Streptosporangiales bacterium]